MSRESFADHGALDRERLGYSSLREGADDGARGAEIGERFSRHHNSLAAQPAGPRTIREATADPNRSCGT